MADDLGLEEISARDALAWIGDWERDYGEAADGLTLVTAHSAKGLEFDHVVVLDDAWTPRPNEDPDEQRRLFYVAMTRARLSLCLLERRVRHAFLPEGEVPAAFLRREGVVPRRGRRRRSGFFGPRACATWTSGLAAGSQTAHAGTERFVPHGPVTASVLLSRRRMIDVFGGATTVEGALSARCRGPSLRRKDTCARMPESRGW
jgi:hypothetical protein